MIPVLLTLFLSGWAPTPTVPPDPGFHPYAQLSPPGGPTIAFFQGPNHRLLSLRLSFPLTEAVEEAGAGQVLRVQALERMQPMAQRIGARVEVHRTPQAIVYQVTGAASDLDFLIWILREGVQPPRSPDFAAARRRVLTEAQRRLETPEGVLALRLRRALSPGEAPVGGTPPVLERLEPSHISALWARSHELSTARLVVVGGVTPEAVLAALTDLGLPSDAPIPQLPPPPSSGEPRGTPEVIRHWTAAAYPVEGRDPTALVLAQLLADRVRETPGDYEIGVEVWDLVAGRALVLSGAAYPRQQTAMRNRVAGLLNEIEGSIDDDTVRRIASGLRTDILVAGRTPDGLAELVGQAWDTGTGPEGIENLMIRLESLRAADLSGLVGTLRARTPVREEIRP